MNRLRNFVEGEEKMSRWTVGEPMHTLMSSTCCPTPSCYLTDVLIQGELDKILGLGRNEQVLTPFIIEIHGVKLRHRICHTWTMTLRILSSYVSRFTFETLRLECSNDELICLAFQNGLQVGPLYTELCRHPPGHVAWHVEDRPRIRHCRNLYQAEDWVRHKWEEKPGRQVLERWGQECFRPNQWREGWTQSQLSLTNPIE